MQRQVSVLFVLVLACAVAVTVVAADQAGRRAQGDYSAVTAGVEKVPVGSTQARVVGTIQYDNDTPFSRSPITNATVGNRFTAPDPHSIASASFRVAQNYGASVVMSLWDANGPSASILFRTIVTGIPQSPNASSLFSAAIAPPIVGHSGLFIGGLRNTAYTGLGCPSRISLTGTCDGVALSQGATNPGFGFNAVYLQLTDGAFPPTQATAPGTGVAITPATNAIFRVTGDNLPVELMGFAAE